MKLSINMKISFLFVLFALFFVFSSTSVYASEKGYWGQNTLDEWTNKGYLSIEELESLNYDANLNRGQFITLINKVFNLVSEDSFDYVDVDQTNPYYKQVRIASKYGYITGYVNDQNKKEFRPNQSITREQAVVIISRVMGFNFDNVNYDKLLYYDVFDINNYAIASVFYMHQQDIIRGYEDGTFKPKKEISYIEAITIIDNLLTKHKTQDDNISGYDNSGMLSSNMTSVNIKSDNENKLHNGIPIVVIYTEDFEAVEEKDKKLNGTMKIIDGEEQSYKTGLYEGPITIKGRGNSTWRMPKKPYAVVTSSSVEILDMPKEKDWVLLANYADKSLIRNYLALYLGGELSLAHTPKMRLVDLFLNGEYQGNYLLGEKVEISESRLNIHELSEDDVTEDKINGGYLIEKDAADRLEEDDFYVETKLINTKLHGFFNIKDPSGPKLNAAQKNYITNYLQEAETALYSETSTDSNGGYEQYFDVESVIDWYIVNELFKNIDAKFHTSVFMHKDINERLKFGPIWDFDIGAGNHINEDLQLSGGFYIKDALWISRFFNDPTFVEKLKNRWNEIVDNQLVNMMQLLDETEVAMKKSADDNFTKWDILGTYVWPNPPGFENRTTYTSEVEYLRQWLQNRIEWLSEAINQL